MGLRTHNVDASVEFLTVGVDVGALKEFRFRGLGLWFGSFNQELPIVSHCSSFSGLPFRILCTKWLNQKKRTTMETIGKIEGLRKL